MDALMPFLILAGSLSAVLGFFAWLAARIRRRGLAGGAMSAAMASYEEAFRITAHEAHVEIRRKQNAERRSCHPTTTGDEALAKPAGPRQRSVAAFSRALAVQDEDSVVGSTD
ncbi:hypothetical protein ACR6C2_21780 [Streptomyces sp. INA 01156]